MRGQRIHYTACVPRLLCCYSQKNSACWIVRSNQVCGVLLYYIKRYHRRSSGEADATSFKCMVRYARTGPALSTQHGLDIGWSATCDREYTIVVHINVCSEVAFNAKHQADMMFVYTMNILHQTAFSTILVGFLHASSTYDTWCKYFASNLLLKNKFSSISSTPSIHADYSSEI